MEFDSEEVERHIPRDLLVREGYAVVTHMLADAIEQWAEDEGSGVMAAYAEKLRALAGPIN